MSASVEGPEEDRREDGAPPEESKTIRFPTAFTVLAIVLLAVWIASFIIPSGAYEIDADTGGPVPGSYQELPSCDDAGEGERCIDKSLSEQFNRLWIAPPNGLYGVQNEEGRVGADESGFLYGSAQIFLFVLAVGAFVTVTMRTESIQVGIGRLAMRFRHTGWALIAVLMGIFALGGTTYGMWEETLGFFALVVPLVLALGYDRLVAASMILFGAGTGVLASTVNPFATGVASDAAGLRAIGISEPATIYKVWDYSGSIGGPIAKDRLWFFGTHRNYGSHTQILNRYANALAGDPTRWDYVEDRSISARNVSSTEQYAIRLTAQATPRNKVGFSFDYQPTCAGSSISADGGCRSRGDDWIGQGGVAASPEATTAYNDGTSKITQATWSSPLTSRLLLEAGVSTYVNRWGWMEPPGGLTNLTPVTEQSALYGIPGFTYRGLDNFFSNKQSPTTWRASAAYVTGAHNMKFGYQGAYYIEETEDFANATGLTYTFNNGQPVSFGWRIAPWQTSNRTAYYAFYAQDAWTLGRATIQGAVRYDHAWSWHPAEHNGAPAAGPFNPSPVTFPETTGVRGYNDITPRVGLAYDVFGNGKTALKVNLGKYLQAAVNQTQYVINNPALDGRNGRGGPRYVTNTSRSWQDLNGNRVPDCAILNPAPQDNSAAGGDVCGQWLNPNFGNAQASTVVNPDVLEGWGVRPYDWQFGASIQQEIVPRVSVEVGYNRTRALIQQEIVPRVSVEVGYNRRWWGNFFVVDNRAIGPQDYDAYTVNVPQHPDLPDGGGYTVTALSPRTLAQNNYYTFADDYGDEQRYWHGVDVTANARLENGLMLTGGTSTGRGVRDNCDIVEALPETLFAFGTFQRADGCDFAEDWITTFRGSAAYTVPKIDVLVSAIVRFQNTAPGFFTTGDTVPGSNGNALAANYQIPNTIVQQALGRLPIGAIPTGTTTVNVVRAGEIFPEQVRTVDMRFAKILRFGRTRTDIGIDLYNLFNSNKATAYNQTFLNTAANPWLRPTQIVDARFLRFNATVNF
jgi:hypothetical protein